TCVLIHHTRSLRHALHSALTYAFAFHLLPPPPVLHPLSLHDALPICFSAARFRLALPAVVRQNSSRDPRQGGSWWCRQAVIGSIEQEDSGGGQPACAHIYIYKGPVENRSGLCRSIITMVQPSESLL